MHEKLAETTREEKAGRGNAIIATASPAREQIAARRTPR
jgi:hypothetical protein